jgi:formate hydrogenlyase transcriptional activator
MDHPSAQVPPQPPPPVDAAITQEASQATQAELRSNNERLKLLLDLNNAIVSNLELRDLLRAISASIRHIS